MTEIEWFHENITFIDILCYLYCCSQYASKFGKLSSGHRTGKGQFSFQSQRKAKECSNYRTIALISHTSKVMLKILHQASTVREP